MQLSSKRTFWPFCLCAVLFFTGCHNYYKAVYGRSGVYAPATVDSLKQLARVFILRNGTQAFFMKNLVLATDRKTLSFTPDTLPPEHRLHLKLGHRRNYQYKKGDIYEWPVLNEVHLYTTGPLAIVPGDSTRLPLEKLQKIEVIEKDKGRTTESYVLGAFGYGLGIAAIAGIIIGVATANQLSHL